MYDKCIAFLIQIEQVPKMFVLRTLECCRFLRRYPTTILWEGRGPVSPILNYRFRPKRRSLFPLDIKSACALRHKTNTINVIRLENPHDVYAVAAIIPCLREFQIDSSEQPFLKTKRKRDI